MAATGTQGITIRDFKDLSVFRLPAVSAGVYYHGTYVALDYTGYIKNVTTGLVGVKAIGILKSDRFEEQANSAITTIGTMTATGNGDLTVNTNCLDVYMGGEFEGTFESTNGITVANEGDTVYCVDNNTLTVSPSLGLYPIGILTKYKTSTTGSIKLFGFKASSAASSDLLFRGSLNSTSAPATPNGLLNVKNPFGASVIVKDFKVYVSTPSTTGGNAAAGVCPTSSGVIASYLVSSSGIQTTSAGIYDWSNTYTTDNPSGVAASAYSRLWKSTEYVSISNAAALSTSLTGWYEFKVTKA